MQHHLREDNNRQKNIAMNEDSPLESGKVSLINITVKGKLPLRIAIQNVVCKNGKEKRVRITDVKPESTLLDKVFIGEELTHIDRCVVKDVHCFVCQSGVGRMYGRMVFSSTKIREQ